MQNASRFESCKLTGSTRDSFTLEYKVKSFKARGFIKDLESRAKSWQNLANTVHGTVNATEGEFPVMSISTITAIFGIEGDTPGSTPNFEGYARGLLLSHLAERGLADASLAKKVGLSARYQGVTSSAGGGWYKG